MASPEKNSLATLTQIYGENINRKFLLRSQVFIGRNPRSQIRLSNPNISRKHCSLTHTDKGWEIVDNKSQNGTYISGKRLKPFEPCLLQCGDIIFLGPPSEMPEAFLFDDTFVEDAAVAGAIDVESEKLPVKRPSDPEVLSPAKKRDSNGGHLNEPINQDSGVNVQHSSSTLKAGASGKSLSSNSASAAVDKKIKRTTKRKCSVVLKSIPCGSSSPRVKVEEEKEQIHEISSTADDQAESSQSLLICSETEGSVDKLSNTSSVDVLSVSPDCHISKKSTEASSSSSLDVFMSPDCRTSNNLSETEALKLKLAKLSAEVKKLQESESNLLNQKKTLVEQLDEQKKLKAALKDCESKAKDEVKNELLEKFEEDLICNICTELLIKPTVLDCSHTFCLYCIKEWKKKKCECPVCRNKIQNMTPVLTLEHFIDKTLSTLTPEQRDKRNQIIKEREELEKKKVATPKRKKPRPSPYRNRRYRSRRPVGEMFQHNGPHNLPTPLQGIHSRRAPTHVFQRSGSHNLPSTSSNRSEVEVIADRRNRHVTTSSGNEVQVISDRRNIVIPYNMNSFIQQLNFRVPEVLLSDSEVDSGISIYITS